MRNRARNYQPAPTEKRLQAELEAFDMYMNQPCLGAGQVKNIDSHGMVYRPSVNNHVDEVDLLFTALVHGDEYAGISILNSILSLLSKQVIQTEISIAFLLCNIGASRRMHRFVDNDMNRVFGRNGHATLEDARAREIEKNLRSTKFCVDFHQTIEPIDHPFFVIGTDLKSAKFASCLSNLHPMVADSINHKSIEDEAGVRADQYMRKHGVVVAAVELGQKGFDNYQISEGVILAIEAIAAVEQFENSGTKNLTSDVGNKIYTWSHTEPFPEGIVSLRPGLKNFQFVEQGKKLGTVDGFPIYAPEDGALLFPKYIDSTVVRKPAALFRIVKEINIHQLEIS